MNILSIDPGREKSGVAILNRNKILHHEVIESGILIEFCIEKIKSYQVSAIVIGDGTSSKTTIANLKNEIKEVPIHTVNEYRTTDAAKVRYWEDNPPTGVKRFIPKGMLIPPCPIDDYAAIILGERYLENNKGKKVPK